MCSINNLLLCLSVLPSSQVLEGTQWAQGRGGNSNKCFPSRSSLPNAAIGPGRPWHGVSIGEGHCQPQSTSSRLELTANLYWGLQLQQVWLPHEDLLGCKAKLPYLLLSELHLFARSPIAHV